MFKRLGKKSLGILALTFIASTAAFADGGWTAIVFNPQNGAWGSFHGATTREGAELGAMAECGPSCAGVDPAALESGQSPLRETWANNGWVAYAIDGTGHWGTGGLHDSQYDAETAAVNNCQNAGNPCYVVRSLSSFDYMPDQSGTNINATAPTPAPAPVAPVVDNTNPYDN